MRIGRARHETSRSMSRDAGQRSLTGQGAPNIRSRLAPCPPLTGDGPFAAATGRLWAFSPRLFLGLLIAAGLVMSPRTVLAQGSDGHGDEEAEVHYPHHVLALFAGAATETKRDVEKQTELATGIEYELRLSHYWGVGGLLELVGDDLVRQVVIFVPVSLHPYKNFRLVGAPGVEFEGEKETFFVFRAGLGYEFHLGKGFTLAPEFNADFIQGGKITYVYGLALGKEF